MNEITRKDIRALLKKFGIKADQAISSYVDNNPESDVLHVRIRLDDLTDYGDSVPEQSLRLEVEGEIRLEELP